MANRQRPGKATKDDLFVPNADKAVGLTAYEKKVAAQDTEAVYTISGQQHDYNDDGLPVLYDVRYEDNQIDYAHDSVDAHAKVTVTSGTERYYAKIGYGGQLRNPIGLYEGAGRRTDEVRMGRAQFTWKIVSARCINFYLEFLKTKNLRHLKNAQREVI